MGEKMKKKIIIILLGILLCSLIFAGDYRIGTGTSTQNYVPFYGYNNYGWSKFIYTSANLTGAGMSGTVTVKKIAFQLGTAITDYVTDNQKIYMAISYNDSYASTATGYPNPASYTLVYNGSITWNGPGWVEITLDTPYNLNSAYALEIFWENRDGSKLAGPPKFRYTSASNTCVYKYSDTSFPTSSGTRYGSRPNIWFMSDPTDVPPAASAITPVDTATNVEITTGLSWFHNGGLPDYYTFSLGTDNPPTNLVAAQQTTSTSYQPANRLEYGTTYYWQVIPHNSFGDAIDCPVWSFSTLPDPSIASFPWQESFDAAVPPNSDWQRYGGVLQDPIVLGGSSLWESDDWLNVSGTDKAAKINIWGNLNGWLVTPLLNIPDNNYYVSFDLSVLKYGQTPTGTAPVYGPDDRFAVLVGDGFSWSTANIVREWNNTGSPDVLSEISVWGDRMVIPLGSNTGHIRIAFYAGSLISNADSDFMINNLEVGQFTTPLAAGNPDPASGATNVPLQRTLSWTRGDNNTTSYDLFLGESLPAVPASSTVTRYTPATLAYGTTYLWKVVPTNPAGAASGCPEWNFTTTSSAVLDAGTVEINGIPVSPTVQVDGLEGNITLNATASYAPVDIGLPNVGLVLQLGCSGTTLSGKLITVNHNLGFIPQQIAYRILPGPAFNTISNPGSWTDTVLSFTVDAKADGDLEIAFPVDAESTLPVELSYFNAVFSNDLFVTVAWISQSETNHSGYNVLRSASADLTSAVKINPLLITEGESSGSLTSYQYQDSEIQDCTTLFYWLESIALDGSSQFYGPVRVVVGSSDPDPETPEPAVYTELHNAYPNPFNPNTNLRYTITEPAQVRIDIFNSRGQLIRSFSRDHSAAGIFTISWDGTDAEGRLVGSGLYLYRMHSGNYQSTKKMLMVK
jgi:hypothetical protein